MTGPLLALALLAAPAAPGVRHPLTIDDLLDLDRVGEPALSPDGRLVAFTVAHPAPDGAKLLSAIWIVEAKGGAPRRLTFGEEKVRAPRFSPDGRRLAFVSSRGGEPRVYLLDLAGGEARPAPRVPGGVVEYRFTPDGAALLALAEVDPACGADLACNERADKAAEGQPYAADRLLFRHWDEWRTRKRVHLVRVPLDGGPLLDLTPGDRDAPPVQRGDLADVAVSADGRTVTYVAVSDPVEAISTNGDLYAVPMAGGEATRLTSAPGWDGTPRPSPDGRRLAWLRQPRAGYEADRRHVMVAGPDGRGERDLTAALDVSADALWWVDGGRALRFTAVEAGRSTVWEVSPDGGAPRRVGSIEGHLAAVDPSGDGRALAAVVDSLLAPGEVALVGRCERGEGLCPKVLTRFGARVMDAVARSEVRRLEATGKDGAPIHGWLVTPPGHRQGERHPGVVLVHGGPQGAWNDAWSYRWNPALYAARGWTVVLPNPRGSTGWGQAYTDAVRDDWGGAPYQDVMALTDAAVASGEADGARLCAAGASYGGYMVNWINGQTDRFRCLVAHAGDFDLQAAYYDTEELWFPEWELGRPWERPAAFTRHSPSAFVERWKTPTLVTHGELDYRVTVTQGISTFTALQRRGVESRLLVFPDENHWILKPRNSRRFHEEVFSWIGRHLAAPPPPSPSTDGATGAAAPPSAAPGAAR
jgi:dipeptidyl aminopeptidase/acylaminoacyl peptidase